MIALYGKAMHHFVLREVEIGTRAAVFEDDEHATGWSAIDDLRYLGWVRRNYPEDRDLPPYAGAWED